ncbi:MAG: tRNA (adenosine(37)-N6)-dimethylallyltransferase MiaA [Oscillospiraceae bacterium]|nr:tRNA (adenosine(37)-N6)-dimethylallyltransferase MiaA [Oscillospiraceae bacterium]
MSIKIIGIVGCTGTGKTRLGVEFAKEMNGEVISCDSMQVYEGMPIATNQPDEEERGGIPHHLIGFLSPWCQYSVADFCADAHRVIADIHRRCKLPVIVGGTGLYYKALTENLQFAQSEKNAVSREKLLREVEKDGGAAMLKKLTVLDPLCAERLKVGGRRRIVRAWERYLTTGLTPTAHDEFSRSVPSPYSVRTIGLDYSDREKLNANLDARVEEMIARGLWEEAQSFFEQQSSTARQAIGHKELFPAMRGEISKEEAIDNLKRATRQYAKRQRTWFRRQVAEVEWRAVD